MLLLRGRAFARAGLIGNPSDGYFGRTISIIVRNFWADVVLYEWEDVELVWSQDEHSRFSSVQELVRDVKLHGYYGGIRLVKATIKRFVEYCLARGIALHKRNFSVRYETNIPRQVGLAGSSAIIVATLRALMQFYDVAIPREALPSLALSVETQELGIAAGLQDRVIQVYEGVVSMDFDPALERECEGFRHGVYETLDPALLPPLYIAYGSDESEPTELVHGSLRARWNAGDAKVIAAMKQFAQLAADGKRALLSRDDRRLGALMDANYDLRRSICDIAPGQDEMIRRARSVGASAKFAGSGGAIIGLFDGQAMYAALQREMAAIGCRVIVPRVT